MSAGANSRRAETLRRKWRENPVWAAEMRGRIRDGKRRAIAAKPELAAQLREHGRWLGRSGLGNAVRPAGSQERKAVGRLQSDRRLAWCPAEYRDLYMHLLKKKHVPAAEARRLVEEQMTADGVEQPAVDNRAAPRPWYSKGAAAWGSRRLGAAVAALRARESRA